MADFRFPDIWSPDGNAVANNLPFGTILGSTSPVSPNWDYLRTRTAPDDDSAVIHRGIAPNVEPPPGSAEYHAAEASLAALQGAVPSTRTASAAVALGMTSAADSQLVTRLAAFATRAVPIAASATPPSVLAVPLIAVPTSIFDDDQALRLGNRFRASQPPGQKSVILEHRVTDGLLGTGVGAKWEELPPLDAKLRVGQHGLKTLVLDVDQLRGTLGPDATNQLVATGRVIDRRADELDRANRSQLMPGSRGDLPPPLSLPSRIEMRIWASTDRGLTTTSREATRKQVQQVCPNFAEYEQYAQEAAAKYKSAGLQNGMEYGRLVHRDVELMLKMDDIQSRLDERGVRELHPELAIRQGYSPSYTKGSSRIDVVELHRDHVTVCVYELKTGGATIPLEVVRRYSREAGLYAYSKKAGYQNIYFIPIHVP